MALPDFTDPLQAADASLYKANIDDTAADHDDKLNTVLSTGLVDVNGNEILKIQTAGVSSVNYLTVKSAIAGNSPEILAEGVSANLDISLVPKGTGVTRIDDIAAKTTNGDLDLASNGTGDVTKNGISIVNLEFLDVQDQKLISADSGGWVTYDMSVEYAAAASAGAKLAYFISVVTVLSDTVNSGGAKLHVRRKGSSGSNNNDTIKTRVNVAAGVSETNMDYVSWFVPLDGNSDFEYYFQVLGTVFSANCLLLLAGYGV